MLGPADAGKYYFAIVVFGWFEIITNYGLNTLLTRDVSRDPSHANRYLVNTTLLRLALGLVVIPGLAALLALLTVLYTTPLLGLGLESPSVEHLIGVAALSGGFLFIWPVMAVDWTPAARPARDRFVLALFACGLLVVVSALVMRSGAALERRWFEDLHLVWADAATDRGWTLGVVAVHVTMLLGLAGWLGLAARRVRPARPAAAPGGRRSPRGTAAARRWPVPPGRARSGSTAPRAEEQTAPAPHPW